MALPSINLKHHLRLVHSSYISEGKLTAFVHFCRSIVEPYLQYVRKSVNLLCEQQGVTIPDLAEDCIANDGSHVLEPDRDKKWRILLSSY
jgi:hypothetical protein